MKASTLAALIAVTAAISDALRRDVPPPPNGDVDGHEDNTFGLPDGKPIRKELRSWYDRQLRDVLGEIPAIGAPIPTAFASLADYNDPMAAAFTPMVSAYWDQGGKRTLEKLGLDPDDWRVVDPNLHKVIAEQTHNFCASTNATTSKALDAALAQLREEFHQGLVTNGEAIPQLTKRVQDIFTGLRGNHAAMIARTEASRAMHAASLISAADSEVVEGKRWIASANSCDRCLDEERKTEETALDLSAAFLTQGDNPVYATVKSPPLHPHCRCTVVFTLTEEYRNLVAGEGGTAPPTIIPLDASSPGVVRRKAA